MNQKNHTNHGSDNVPELRFPEFEEPFKPSKLKDVTSINQGLQINVV